MKAWFIVPSLLISFLRNNFVTDKFHGNIKSKHYVRPKSNALCFAIHHYAGRVVYHADGFLDKNRNFLPPEVIQLLRQSHRDMVRFLFQCPITKTGNLYSISQESPRETPIPGSKVYSINFISIIQMNLGSKLMYCCYFNSFTSGTVL